MMNNNERKLRQTASEEFLQSYEKQLLNAFQEPKVQPEQPTTPESMSLSDLEAAIADIDDYLQTQDPPSQD